MELTYLTKMIPERPNDELNVRKWMSDRLNRRRVAQTIYIMESRSTLNSTSPSFLTPQHCIQWSPFKEYFHRIFENYHRPVPIQAPMTPLESEVQTLLGPKRPPTSCGPQPCHHLSGPLTRTPPKTLWNPLLHDPKTETPQQDLWPKWPMTSKTEETIEKNRVWQTLRSLVRVRFQSWEDYPYWHYNQRLTMSLTVEASLFGCIFYWERCWIPPRFIYRVCWIQSQILPSSQFTLNELVNNTSDFPLPTFAGIQFLSHSVVVVV